MKKVFLQDIVPAGKRSIRNIPLPNAKSAASESKPVSDAIRPARSSRSGAQMAQTEEKVSKSSPPKGPVSRTPSGARFSTPLIWVVVVVVVLILGYASSFLFVSATVSVTPKEINLPVSLSGSAAIDPAGAGLGFTVVTLSREASKQIAASGTEKVDRKASGKIVIYNNFSKDTQKLIANTRFETPTGLIFRIQQAVSVPGQKIVNGTTIPGSATATVYADQPGASYNVGLSDFVIPGFKGDAKYTKITAKSDPKFPIKDGFTGMVAKVSPADSAAAKVSIETQLKNKLHEDLQAQIPDSHILFSNAYIFNFEDSSQSAASAATPGVSTSSTTLVSEKGSIYGILFNRKALSQYIASQKTEVGQKDVLISNLDTLAFSLNNKEAFDPTSTKQINFSLTGDAKFVWNLDPSQVTASLVGQKRANIKDVLSGFEAIDRANVTIHPIWIFTMPNKADKIHVDIQPAA